MGKRKKSHAQIQRMIKRAKERGEEYIPIESSNESKESNVTKESRLTTKEPTEEASTTSKIAILARQLQEDIRKIENDTSLKAKERRSAKRKAEAIALEASGLPTVDELYQAAVKVQVKPQNDSKKNITTMKKKTPSTTTKKHSPYILFVGQLSYDTTHEQLRNHFTTHLADDFPDAHITVRLLTTPDSKKSRGMGFVEFDDPSAMYHCLQLHLTQLESRRINVERTTGGGKQSRPSKLTSLRDEQKQVMEQQVRDIFADYAAEVDDLDAGVMALCQRHAGTVVRAALERFVETSGMHKDNPSAYLTFLLTKLSQEGIYTNREEQQQEDEKPRYEKRVKPRSTYKSSSVLESEGVDMKVSKSKGGLESIFPSLRSRGRGGRR